MGQEKLSEGAVKILKLVAVSTGIMLIAAAVFADLIGFVQGQGSAETRLLSSSMVSSL